MCGFRTDSARVSKSTFVSIVFHVQKEDKLEDKEKLSDVVELNQNMIITPCLHKRHFVTFKISANYTRYIIMQKNVSEG